MAGSTGQFDMVGGSTRYGKFEDFVGSSQATNHNGAATGVTENSGTADTLAATEDGVFTLVTGTSSGNQAMVVFDRNYRADRNGIVMEAGITSHTALTSRTIFVGFTDLTTINSGLQIASGTTITKSNSTADAVGFIFDSRATSTTNWYTGGCKGSNVTAATLVTSAQGGALTADTYQNLRVQVDTNGYAYFFLNGVQVGMQNLNSSTGQGGLANAVTTSTLLTPVVAVAARTTAAQTVYVDYMYCQKGRYN